jgi:hypothetical protein
MWRQEMLPSTLHGCHFDTTGSFSIQNFVPDIFYQTSSWKKLKIVTITTLAMANKSRT